jgi:hypothetical protein
MSEAIKFAVASLAAAWAERDPGRRAELIASAVTDDFRMVMGDCDASGRIRLLFTFVGAAPSRADGS